MAEFTLAEADLWENGRAPILTGQGYYTWGTGARWVWTTSARGMEVDAYAITTAGRQIGVRVTTSEFCRDYYYSAPALDDETTVRVWLPAGAKTVELIVPGHHAASSAGTPGGAFPIRVRFDAAATAVARPTPTNRLFVLGDSIAVGGNAICEAHFGWTGLAKRGLSCQGMTAFKGAYSPATTYAVGDLTSYQRRVWKKRTTAAAGTTPANGANWEFYGFDGTVTLWRAWGFKRVADDWSSGGDRTASAALLAGASPTQLLLNIGSNDHSTVPPTTLANFTTYFEGMLDAIHAVLPTIPIACVSPIYRGDETANSNGHTMAQFRTAISDAVTARAGWAVPPTYVDGLAICDSGDLADGVHPTTSVHATNMLPAAMAAV